MLRVFYAAGPGNAFAVFRDWKEACPDLTTSHVSYSRQLLEACSRHEAAALITCTYEGDEEQVFGNRSIVRRPDPCRGKSGLCFHFSLYEKARQNIRDALAFGANVLIISEDTNPNHYMGLRRRGIHIVQTLHTCLWCEGRSQKLMQRLRLWGCGRAYSSGAVTVLSPSNVTSGQVEQLSGARAPRVLEFLPLYDRDHYSDIPAPDYDALCLRILFIGRIEVDKGAVDLVEIAKLLDATGTAFQFDICGTGSAFDMMKHMVNAQNLTKKFVFHGWCDRNALRRIMSESHACIVPTRSDIGIGEGFNQVIIEAILSRRPVVASSICPAVHYVSEAVEIVPANDLRGYATSLRELSIDRDKLRRRAQACHSAGRRFVDRSYSFGTALDEVFSALRNNRPVIERRIRPREADCPIE